MNVEQSNENNQIHSIDISAQLRRSPLFFNASTTSNQQHLRFLQSRNGQRNDKQLCIIQVD